MTADAKVGLLLGLVFIVIIAFLINGLPNILKADSGTEITKNTASDVTNNWAGVKSHANEVIKMVGDQAPPIRQSNRTDDARFTDTADKTTITSERPVDVLPIGNGSTGFSTSAAKPPKLTKPFKSAVRHYTIVSGDNLSAIAIKVYGTEEGNRLVNIDKIYNANKGRLSSKDDIRIGQKLIVPPLVEPIFQAVERPFSPATSVVNRIRTAVNNIGKSKSTGYTVKEGDSLWKIAAEKLGNGNRYHEILKLNSSTLSDEDTLAAGTKLKLPAK